MDVCTHGLIGDDSDWLTVKVPRTLDPNGLTSCCQDLDVQAQDGARCKCCGGRIENDD